MHGCKDELVVEYKGATLVFYRNKNDGLYYIQLNRIKEDSYCQCNSVEVIMDNWEVVGKKNKVIDRSKWKAMNRMEAHQKWGHQHDNQLNRIVNHHQIRLVGKMTGCAGCSLVQSKALGCMKN